MKQYHDHLKAIIERGSYKEPAREGMPGSTSLFGYQCRYNLQEGFPILTTKKINFKKFRFLEIV
jgi:thymidylate synthase